MERSKRVTIFEGPDGGGKSTLAMAFAKLTGARYVHLGPFKGVKHGLVRFYVEAMMPAILGYQDVVLDRSWYSEAIYGAAFRGGEDRIGLAGRRALDRLALRCGAFMVLCRPSWETILDSFRARKGMEMMDTEVQLRQVYDLYQALDHDIPALEFNRDHPHHANEEWIYDYISVVRPEGSRTPTAWRSAGYLNAAVLIVGDDFSDHKEIDSLYQWPFGSVSPHGCSAWLGRQLEHVISESVLCWVNAMAATNDELIGLAVTIRRENIITLGANADNRLRKLGITAETTYHPQYWKRFRTEEYPLITRLKEINS